AALEQERPTTCPTCGIELAGKDRYSHLVTVHGYLDLDGTLLPRATVLTRLWDRIFLHGDLSAHRRLLGVFDAPTAAAPAAAPKDQVANEGQAEKGGAAYGAALEDELSRRLPSAGTVPRVYIDHLR